MPTTMEAIAITIIDTGATAGALALSGAVH
jgi:hypothetical protein